jgi:outer membrane receptor protein involved in Fe transport
MSNLLGEWVAVSVRRALGTLVAVTLFSVAALAQTETGQIIGKISDPNGASVPNANVTVKSVDTNRTVTATSNDEGIYTVTNLQPGLYEVTVNAPGFAATPQRVQVTVGSRTSLDTTLTVGGVGGETVNVTSAGGVEVNTQNQELSDVVTGTQIRELPTLTRDPYALVGLSGNVSSDDPGTPVPGVGVSGRGAGYNINGLRSASTNVLLDGADNNNAFLASVGERIPLDAVGEFRVITSNFSAEYGRASGGIINVVTRSGSNEFHGSLYEFNRISKLVSNGFNANANNQRRGVFTRNQFGYAIGGPVFAPHFGEDGKRFYNLKDKLFFFNSTEWTRVRSSGPLLAIVPTPQLIAASNPATQNYFSLFPLKANATPTGQVLTVGDVVNQFAIPAGNAFAALPSTLPAFRTVAFPEPTDLGGGIPQDYYSTVTRIDWNLSEKTQIYGRYAVESQKYALGTTGFSPYAGFDTLSSNFNQNALVSLTHTFNPNFVSQTKLVFNRLRNDAPFGAQPIVPGLFFFPGPTGTLAGQQVTLPGYWPYNAAASPVGFGGPQNLGQVFEDINYTRGNHQIRFGGQFVYIQDNRLFAAYDTAVESLGTQGNYPQALNNFVTGQLRQFQAAVFPQGKFPGQQVTLPVGPPQFTRSNRYKEWAVYVNDSWRFRPNLVLNFGLRYEYYGVQHNKDPRLDSNFYFGPGATLPEQYRNGTVQIAPDSPVGGLWAPDKNNFAPRIGFAWDVFGDGRTSVRGGYGIAYERNFGNVTFNVIQNPPNYAVLALIAPQDVPFIAITPNNFGPLAGSTGTVTLPITSLRHVRQDIRNAYAHFWSAALERQIGQDNLLSVEYSGSAGRKLYSVSSFNVPGGAAIFFGDPDPNARENAQFGTINTRGNDGRSNYNALIVNMRGNNLYRLGLQYTASYTFSRTKDNLSSSFSDSFTNYNVGFTDPYDPSLDYGFADFDVRHRFVASFNWEIPLGRNRTDWRRHALGGWALSGIFTARTGTPFTIFDGTNANARNPRLVPNGGLGVSVRDTGAPNTFNFIDLAGQPVGAFINPVCNCSDFGPYPANMTRRNQFRSPGIWSFDSALYKTFKITETSNIQLRAEVFNLFNHANLYILPGTLDVGSGAVQAARGVTINQNFERRNVQLAVKFNF